MLSVFTLLLSSLFGYVVSQNFDSKWNWSLQFCNSNVCENQSERKNCSLIEFPHRPLLLSANKSIKKMVRHECCTKSEKKKLLESKLFLLCVKKQVKFFFLRVTLASLSVSFCHMVNLIYAHGEKKRSIELNHLLASLPLSEVA